MQDLRGVFMVVSEHRQWIPITLAMKKLLIGKSVSRKSAEVAIWKMGWLFDDKQNQCSMIDKGV
jgi:hypothetical protein